jgi:ABC-type nitrate/sulfonate/bicarbonate transport system permease component
MAVDLAPAAATNAKVVQPPPGGTGGLRSKRRPALLKRWGIPLASIVVFLGIWQVIGNSVDPILFATPSAVASAFVAMIRDGQLLPAFLSAMGDLAVGYGLAAVIGIALGMIIGRSELIERVTNPYVNFFQATPLIALVPLVVIWFGVGFQARIFVIFLFALWSVLINTAVGVKSTPRALLDVGRVYKFNRYQTIMSLALPAAVPSIFAGLRIALGKALIGMVIAQMNISVTGLGGLVVDYGNAFKTAYLLAAIITASMVGVIAAAGLEALRRVLFPWTKPDGVSTW